MEQYQNVLVGFPVIVPENLLTLAKHIILVPHLEGLLLPEPMGEGHNVTGKAS